MTETCEIESWRSEGPFQKGVVVFIDKKSHEKAKATRSQDLEVTTAIIYLPELERSRSISLEATA